MISFTMMYSKEKNFRLIFSKNRLYNTLYRIIHVNYYNPTDMDIIFYKIHYADNSPHQFYYINIIIFQAVGHTIISIIYNIHFIYISFDVFL